MFVTNGVTETMQQQVVIAHVIREIFIMWKMLDASCNGLCIGIMVLKETGELFFTIPVSDFALFDVVAKQQFGLQFLN